VAAAAFYCGLAHTLASEEPAPEHRLPFATARDNFYAAARHGLDAEITWLDGRQVQIAPLLRERLLPAARAGLQALGLDADDIRVYLGLLGERIACRKTGAAWQRARVAHRGADMAALTLAYAERQASGRPLMDWTL
jgi:hypothetical protein